MNFTAIIYVSTPLEDDFYEAAPEREFFFRLDYNF